MVGAFLVNKINISIPAGERLTATLALPDENINGDNLGVYFWGGTLTSVSGDAFMAKGLKLSKNLGTHLIRIYMGPRADIDYKNGSCIQNFTLTDLAQTPDFNAILNDPQFSTIVITAYDGVSSIDSFGNCYIKNYLDPNFYSTANTQKIKDEYTDFANYLKQFADKKFIILNWEGDNDIYCGDRHSTLTDCPTAAQSLRGLKKWLQARSDGIKAADASNVFSGIDFNLVSKLDKPTVLYDVIPYVDADYYAYSSYDSYVNEPLGVYPTQLGADIDTLRNALASFGKNRNNLLIGEFGYWVVNDINAANKLKEIAEVIKSKNVPYALVWMLLENPPGYFGMYDSSGNLTTAGKTLFPSVPTPTPTPRPRPNVPVLSLINTTEFPRGSDLWDTDAWRIEVKNGKPNEPVEICGTQGDKNHGCTPAKDMQFTAAPTTDENGNWFMEGNFYDVDEGKYNGSWTEWVLVGGIKSNTMTFTVSSPVKNRGSFRTWIEEFLKDIFAPIETSQRFVGERLAATGGLFSGLVPCGRSKSNPDNPPETTNPCTICDGVGLISNIFNFVVFTVVPAVATLLFLAAGFLILLGGAVPAQVAQGRAMFRTTVYGLLIIFGAWMITNTILQSLASDKNISDRWYKIECTTSETGAVIPPAGGGGGAGGGGAICQTPQTLAQQNHEPYPTTNAPELNNLISCIKSKLPGQNLGEQSTYDKSHTLCNYTRGQRTCDSCSHAVNSCHYGGKGGTQGSLAVDFGNEAIGDKIIQAAQQCGAKSGGARCETASGAQVSCTSSSANHVHINAASCDSN